MKLGIKDIAKKAKVSSATVSRAINKETRHLVASSTLKRIDKVIKDNDYNPNLAAKFLRKTSTKTIGVIFPAFQGVFSHTHYSNLLSGIADCLMNSEYQFKMLLLKPEPDRWAQYDFRSVENIDGLIVTHWPEIFTQETAAQLKLPCVFINDVVPELPVYFVCGDHFTGGQIAARHLYQQGHKEFAIFKGVSWCLDNHLRADGFQDFLKEKNIFIPESKIICAEYSESEAYAKVEGLMKNNPKVTAIFCCNDEMALGVLRRLQEMKISCPSQISIIGFDDISRAASSIPALTTVRFPEYQAAFDGARELIKYLEKGEFETSLQGQKFYPVELIERQSTGRIA